MLKLPGLSIAGRTNKKNTLSLIKKEKIKKGGGKGGKGKEIDRDKYLLMKVPAKCQELYFELPPPYWSLGLKGSSHLQPCKWPEVVRRWPRRQIPLA